jgi:hypothetical protein
MSADFKGPDDLAAALQAVRHRDECESASFGSISADGLRHLVRVAYFASQAPNEGRFPRLTLLVPAKGESVRPLVQVTEKLDVPLLRRIGPAVSSQDHAIVVSERNAGLEIEGISALGLGDSHKPTLLRPKGLILEILRPGEIRAVEYHTFHLQAGLLHQEVSFTLEKWFSRWYDEAASDLKADGKDFPFRPGFAFANTWMRLLSKAAALQHGGCFVILPEPEKAPIQHAFTTRECHLGSMVVVRYKAICANLSTTSNPLVSQDLIDTLGHMLNSTVDAIAHLSAADGCVVFNRKLQLYSFGGMIETNEVGSHEVPCFLGNSSAPVGAEEVRRMFGARRRSALQLCRSCFDAMVFVISQDGDLRLFVRDTTGVRFFDHAAYW